MLNIIIIHQRAIITVKLREYVGDDENHEKEVKKIYFRESSSLLSNKKSTYGKSLLIKHKNLSHIPFPFKTTLYPLSSCKPCVRLTLKICC